MGDIDWYMRQKYSPEEEAAEKSIQILFYLRDPSLSDEENLQLHRVYCGNPFIAPGHIGAKTKRNFYINGIMQSAVELVADEYFEEHDESMMPNIQPIVPVIQNVVQKPVEKPQMMESVKEPSPVKETTLM